MSHIIPIFAYYGAPDDPEPDEIVNNKVISFRDLPPGDVATEKQKKFELPLAYFEDGKKYDALPALRDYKKPKLFIYGSQDGVNLPEYVMMVYKESADPKMIHSVNSDHDYRYHPQIIKEINGVIGNFLEANQ